MMVRSFVETILALFFIIVIEQHILDINAEKQLSYDATDV